MNETAYIQGNERTIRERNALSLHAAFPIHPDGLGDEKWGFSVETRTHCVPGRKFSQGCGSRFRCGKTRRWR